MFRLWGGRTNAVVVAMALAVSLLVACSSENVERTAPGQAISATAVAGSGSDLRGVCPATVVVQTNWWPQGEYGALYHLLGGTVTEDTDHKKVSAPLTTGGVDTGVTIQIASGGPANSYTPAAKMLYLDRSVVLGGVDVDQAAQFAASQPVLSVFAPMDVSPVVLLWDPDSLPTVRSVADLGRSGTRILYFPGSAYMDNLVGSGIVRQSQIDSSYDGTPSRFVAEGGKIAQQGYLTNEVYQYEHELPQWGKKVSWQLVDDLGYPNYPETLAIRTDRKAELEPCLKKLVPILQRSAVEYLMNPDATNRLITKLVSDFGGYPYSLRRGANAVAVMKRYGIMGNGPNRTSGDFDMVRVQRLLDLTRPIYARRGTALPAKLTANSLVTNEFIDQSVGMKSVK